MMKTLLAALIALQPAQALACMCVPIEDATPREVTKLLRDHPVIVKARIASTDYPLACRIAPLRWFTTLFLDRTVEVRHHLSVTGVIKGKAARRLTVVQNQWVDYGGCVAGSEVSCEISLRTSEDLWILKPAGKSAFKRAGWCASRAIIEVLATK